MDLSEMVTAFFLAIALSLLVIDTLFDWLVPLKDSKPVIVAPIQGQHSLDPKVACDIVWC
jgi:hypothetical protein